MFPTAFLQKKIFPNPVRFGFRLGGGSGRSSTFDESEKKPESDAGTLGFENIQLIKKFSTCSISS